MMKLCLIKIDMSTPKPFLFFWNELINHLEEAEIDQIDFIVMDNLALCYRAKLSLVSTLQLDRDFVLL